VNLFENVICCWFVIFSLRRHRGERIAGRVSGIVWVLSFALQLALVPMAILSISPWLGTHLKEAALPYDWLDLWVKVVQTLMPDLAGFVIGYLVSRFPAALREPGRWIFVIPAIGYPILFVTSFVVDLHRYYVAVFGVNGGEYDGLGVIGLIFPAAGICLYSIGIRAGDRYTHPLANVFGDEDVIPEDGPQVKAQRKVDPDMVDVDTDVPKS
jgi:hypothetical protein